MMEIKMLLLFFHFVSYSFMIDTLYTYLFTLQQVFFGCLFVLLEPVT